MPHARRVLDQRELDFVTQLSNDFKEAINGTEGKVLPDDEVKPAASNRGATKPGSAKEKLSLALKNRLAGL
jgi:hypothetical protein